MNNYEKIKNMTVDEMAEFLLQECINICVYNNEECLDYGADCKDGIKQWLEQESEV